MYEMCVHAIAVCIFRINNATEVQYLAPAQDMIEDLNTEHMYVLLKSIVTECCQKSTYNTITSTEIFRNIGKLRFSKVNHSEI